MLVPVYGLAMDTEAMQIYESILPDHEILGIDSEDIIQRAGAVHCITMQHHSDNPLIVLHDPLERIPADVSTSVGP